MVSQAQIDEFRRADAPPQELFIDGTWQAGSGEALEVCSPIGGQTLTTLTRATAGVWTGNLSRAGIVHVNTYGGSDNTVPLGGVKQSGNGHDKSLYAIDKYLDLKTVWIQL